MRVSRLSLVAVAAACAALAMPALASAEDFCVGEPPSCTGTAVPANGLADVLSEAENQRHGRPRLPRGKALREPAADCDSSEKLELIGADPDNPSVLHSTAPGTSFTLGGNPASTISNLLVVPSGDANRGLALDGTRAERITVEVPGAPHSTSR